MALEMSAAAKLFAMPLPMTPEPMIRSSGRRIALLLRFSKILGREHRDQQNQAEDIALQAGFDQAKRGDEQQQPLPARARADEVAEQASRQQDHADDRGYH